MNKVICGDALKVLKTLDSDSIDCVVTSPPYFGLRDYGVEGQLGNETTYQEYVNNLVIIFNEVKRVLKPTGTCWLNLGDSYNGNKKGNTEIFKNKAAVTKNFEKKLQGSLPAKNLLGIPWRVAFALQDAGWILRQDIIWSKSNPMPESVKDRCTKSHEYIFLLAKNKKYFFNADAIKEPTITRDKNLRDRDISKLNNTPGRSKMGGLIHNNYDFKNKRSVWNVSSRPYKEAHFATFPEALIEPCILAGCPQDGVVLDPFAGAGTTLLVAKKQEKAYLGIELNPNYIDLINKRLDI